MVSLMPQALCTDNWLLATFPVQTDTEHLHEDLFHRDNKDICITSILKLLIYLTNSKV